jgi:hypothetical protein
VRVEGAAMCMRRVTTATCDPAEARSERLAPQQGLLLVLTLHVWFLLEQLHEAVWMRGTTAW